MIVQFSKTTQTTITTFLKVLFWSSCLEILYYFTIHIDDVIGISVIKISFKIIVSRSKIN